MAATSIDELVEILDLSLDEAEQILTSAKSIVEARNLQIEMPATEEKTSEETSETAESSETAETEKSGAETVLEDLAQAEETVAEEPESESVEENTTENPTEEGKI